MTIIQNVGIYMLTLLFMLARGSTEHLSLPKIILIPLDILGYTIQIDLLIPQQGHALRTSLILTLSPKASTSSYKSFWVVFQVQNTLLLEYKWNYQALYFFLICTLCNNLLFTLEEKRYPNIVTNIPMYCFVLCSHDPGPSSIYYYREHVNLHGLEVKPLMYTVVHSMNAYCIWSSFLLGMETHSMC